MDALELKSERIVLTRVGKLESALTATYERATIVHAVLPLRSEVCELTCSKAMSARLDPSTIASVTLSVTLSDAVQFQVPKVSSMDVELLEDMRSRAKGYHGSPYDDPDARADGVMLSGVEVPRMKPVMLGK